MECRNQQEKIAVCIEICKYLENNGADAESTKHVPTQKILAALGIRVDDHNTVRSLMHRMADSEVLSRRGQGKFAWKVQNGSWDRDNPLTAYYKNPRKGGQQGNEGQGQKANEDKGEAEKNKMVVSQQRQLEKQEQQIKDLQAQLEKAKKAGPQKITIEHKGKKNETIELGRVHPVFEQVMFHIGAGDSVMLVGPKGCGKTYLSIDVAKALNLDYGMLSLSGGVTESRLFGRNVPNVQTGQNEFHPGLFIEMFEGGGLFLLDEVDAADPNMIVALNSALANGEVAVDRAKNPVITKHDDFVCIAAANTWGTGADRQYVGRNQQDSAFTERFVQIAMTYDHDLELDLGKNHIKFVERFHRVRANVEKARLERTVSTRFLVRAINWIERGKDEDYAMEMLFAGWRDDERRKALGFQPA